MGSLLTGDTLLVGLVGRRWRTLLGSAVLGAVIAGSLSLVVSPSEPSQFTFTSESLLLTPAGRSEVELRIETGQLFTATASYAVLSPLARGTRADWLVRSDIASLAALFKSDRVIDPVARAKGVDSAEFFDRLDIMLGEAPLSINFSLDGESVSQTRTDLTLLLSELMAQAASLGIDTELLTQLSIRLTEPRYPAVIEKPALEAIRAEVARELVNTDPSMVMNSGEVIGPLLRPDFGESSSISVLLGPVGAAAESATPEQRARVAVVVTDQNLSVAQRKAQETRLEIEDALAVNFNLSSREKSPLLSMGSTWSQPPLVGEGFAIFGGVRIFTNMLLGLLIGLGSAILFVFARKSYRQSFVNMSQE